MAKNLYTEPKTFNVDVVKDFNERFCYDDSRLGKKLSLPKFQIGNHFWSLSGDYLDFYTRNLKKSSFPITFYIKVQPHLESGEIAVLKVSSASLQEVYYFKTIGSQNKKLSSDEQLFGPYYTNKIPSSNTFLLKLTLTFKTENPNNVQQNIIFEEEQIILPSLSHFLEYSTQLFQTHEFSDVVIKVEDKELLAHKVLLSSYPVFKAMFDKDLRKSDSNVVQIQGFEFEVISEMLKFIYTHKTPHFRSAGGNVEPLPLYKASHKYGIKSLLVSCRNELLSLFNIDGALDVLLAADLAGDTTLKKAVLDFICQNPPALDDASKYERIVQQRPGLMKDILLCKFKQK